MLTCRVMGQRRCWTAKAGLCVYACGSLLVQDLGGAARQPARAPARIEIAVLVGSGSAPNATVIAAREDLQHVASATTDPDGRALFIVPAGRYRVSASLDGHQRRFTVVRADGGATVSVRLQLTPSDPFAAIPPGSGVVSGRVVAMNGDPVPYASVMFYEQYTSGGVGQTEADGTFRIPVRAHASPKSAYDRVTVSPYAHIWPDVPPTVWLPDRTDLKRSVRVREKQETAGLELQVPTSPHYRVTVTLRDELGGALYNPTVNLYGRNRSASPKVEPDDTAVFGPLPPGAVTIFGAADGRNGVRLAGVAELEVVDRPLDDVVITMVPAARLRGRVEFSPPERSPRDAPMVVMPTVPGGPLPPLHSDDLNGRVGPDGSFVIGGLIGTRCLRIWYMPTGWRLGAILRDGRDITDEPITFGPGQQMDDVIVRLIPGAEQATGRPTCDSR